MKYRTGGMHDMGRPKGSKNKPKFNKVKPVEDDTLFHWNETIQKLNQMKEKGDWTQIQNPVFIDSVPKELCIDTESTISPSTEEQSEPEPEPEPEPESKELKKGRKPATD